MKSINQSHIDYLKKQHAFASRRVGVNLYIVFENTGLADIQLAKSLQKDGIKKTLERIESSPTYFGKLKGRSFLGTESKERQNAKAMTKAFKHNVEREYLLRLEYKEAQRLEQLRIIRDSARNGNQRERI